MQISRLKPWLSNPGVIVFSISLVVLVLYMHFDRGMSWLRIAFVIPAVVAIGILILALFAFLSSFVAIRTSESKIDYGGGRRSVEVDFSSPLNRGVLEYLRKLKPKRKVELESASPTSVKSPLAKTQTHPEVGVQLWDKLAASLPVDCRWIVCETPALVHPQTGVLFGAAIGMAYCLRLTEADMERALQAGVSTETRFSDGSTLNLASELGPDWVFGSWEQAELEWCRAQYEALGRVVAGEAAPEVETP